MNALPSWDQVIAKLHVILSSRSLQFNLRGCQYRSAIVKGSSTALRNPVILTTIYAMTLGQRIRHLRAALGLSQLQLAQRISTGRAMTVSQWETDHTVPNRATLR